MYNIAWDIQIGNYKLALMESVQVSKSVERLNDTATIVLPGYVVAQPLRVKDKISEGDTVSIRLGYDHELKDVFEGYVESITTDSGSLQINCECAIFLYRKRLEDVELRNISLRDLLTHVNREIGNFGLSSNYEFRYDKFVIKNATGFDVLKKIQDETRAHIFFRDNTLHVHAQYSEIGNDGKAVIYDLYKNVEKSNLKFRTADQRRLEVEVVSTLQNGTRLTEMIGQTGGERRTINLFGITDRPSLIERGKQELANVIYTGYTGSFTGWLLPFCEPTFKVQIRDRGHLHAEGRQGDYYVIGTETRVSRSGGEQTITIGKKLG